MKIPSPTFSISLLYTFLLLFSSFTENNYGIIRGVSSLGINYGQVGNDLPPPAKVLTLIRSMGLTKVRIYDTNPQILAAFANSGVELVVTVENEILSTLTDPRQGLQWVNTRLRPYFPATNITGIAVGNEIFTDQDATLASYVVPAMISIHQALVQLGMDSDIRVSSPTSLAVLAASYPPSSGAFKPELGRVMSQFLSFLAATNAPFWVNAYPYFAYKDDPKTVSLDYVLFNPNQGMTDPYTRLSYDNMLYAQVDAAVFAISRMGFGGIEVKVSETGWPSKGDADEVGATVANAATYNRNLMRRQMRNEGTPVRPNVKLDVYVFALFNEDLKPGPTSERNYGLFQPDCTMAYNVGISTLGSPTTTSTSTPTTTTASSTSAPTSISFTSSAHLKFEAIDQSADL
ncbi:hypothetical protein V2J09_009358 [Rumex salicifolius]